MKRKHFALGVLAVLATVISASAGAEKSAVSELSAIEQACRDYVEGFYESSGSRIESGVYTGLVKRTPENNGLRETTREKLVEVAKSKKWVKPEVRVEIFDVYKDIASAKVTSDFIDYVQLAKLDNRWQVVNVIWMH